MDRISDRCCDDLGLDALSTEDVNDLFDATQTMVAKIADDLFEVQVVSWYDNENSYTSQMVRTIKYFGSLIAD